MLISVLAVVMRGSYLPPTVEDFNGILKASPIKTIRGGSLSDIEIFTPSTRSIRGRGLFTTLAGLARKMVTPFLSRVIKPAALEFGKNVISDISEGNNGTLKQVFKRRGFEALKSAGSKMMRGEGGKVNKIKVKKKKKKKGKKTCVLKSRAYKDVFSF